MSHELEFTNGKANFVYVGQKAWHGLGKELAPGQTPEMMLKEAGLDWSVDLVPAYAEVNGKKIDIGAQALVRSSDDKVLDVVSDDWKPLQNSEAFSFFDEFCQTGSMQMETAGSLKGGQIVFGLARVDKTIEVIKGDPINQYLLFTNPHVYGRSIDIRLTPIRVVCNNTLTMSLNSTAQMIDNRASSVRQNHRKAFDAETVKETLGLADDKFRKFGEAMTFLASKRYDPTKIEYYMSQIFPHYNAEEREKGVTSRTAKKVLENFNTHAGKELGEGSFYELFNLVTFATNHTLGRSADSRLRSNWYGINAGRNAVALETLVKEAEVA